MFSIQKVSISADSFEMETIVMLCINNCKFKVYNESYRGTCTLGEMFSGLENPDSKSQAIICQWKILTGKMVNGTHKINQEY